MQQVTAHERGFADRRADASTTGSRMRGNGVVIAVGAAALASLVACGRIDLGSQSLRGSEMTDGGSVGGSSAGSSPQPPEDASTGQPPTSSPGAEGTGPVALVPAAPAGSGPASGASGPASDAGFEPRADAAPVLPEDTAPPSCRSASEELCGPSSDSCCLTLPVAGGSVALPVDAGGTRVQVVVSSFFLDKFEVTVGRFRAFLAGYDDWRGRSQPAPGTGSHPHVPGSGWQASDDALLPENAALFEQLIRECNTIPLSTLDLPNTSSRVPLNCVTWVEAAAFCAWDGARLPTYAEWHYAAAGGSLDRVYPWGNEPTPSRLYASYGCALGLERPECTAAYVLPVGSHPSGAGFFQQQDLAGSMTEWLMGGSLDELSDGCTDCAGLTAEPARFWKGGSWIDDASFMTNSYFAIVDPTFRLPFLGLRCARDAP